MFEDEQGTVFNASKIVWIGPSTYKGVIDGVSTYQHLIKLDGCDEPVNVNWDVVERIRELAGQAISAAPDFYVVDFSHSERGSSLLEPVIGWIIPSISDQPPIPITIKGANNGRAGSIWPILHPSGKVTEIDDEWPSLSACLEASKG